MLSTVLIILRNYINHCSLLVDHFLLVINRCWYSKLVVRPIVRWNGCISDCLNVGCLESTELIC